eukprot:scaffold28035_cov211-Skeletonema_marinoi.AAC.5
MKKKRTRQLMRPDKNRRHNKSKDEMRMLQQCEGCTNQIQRGDARGGSGSGSMVQEQNDEDVDDDGAAKKSVGKRN